MIRLAMLLLLAGCSIRYRVTRLADGRELCCLVIRYEHGSDLRCANGVSIFEATNFELGEECLP